VGEIEPTLTRLSKLYARNPKSETRNPKPATLNPKPCSQGDGSVGEVDSDGTRVMLSKPETRNSRRGHRQPKPETRNSKTENRKPKSCAQGGGWVGEVDLDGTRVMLPVEEAGFLT